MILLRVGQALLDWVTPKVFHPARMVVAGFGIAVLSGTILLSLTTATETGQGASFVTALFTATSAVCVTGLIVVDTPEYWSTFGEVTILALFQLGGFGIMTSASLLALLVSGRLGLRGRLMTRAETKNVGVLTARRVILGVIRTSLVLEAVTAAILVARLAISYDEPLPRAIYLGVFHAVSAFNNAGFSLYSDSLVRFVDDPWISVPVAGAAIAGSLGFPVLFELRRELIRPRGWSLHTKITVGVSAVLLVVGMAVVTAAEWANRETLGSLSGPGKLLAGFFQAAMPRSAGFNTVDLGEMNETTWFALDVLMFIGGGSASTAGGIKVTTFALLAFVIWAELRGEPHVNVLGRRLPEAVQRQALAIALLSVGAVVVSTLVLLSITTFELDRVLFDVISAFGTVGLSTGITADLPPTGHVILTVLMFAGRLGPVTLGVALALRGYARHYQLPEERPIVG